jgi:hypothetical protein
MRVMAIALFLSAGIGHAAEAPRLVNLLGAVPTTVAVSSTVANANLVPEHLVDGKLSTAWNSKTGELIGAWIAVRLPALVQVKSIKLTAGFVHKNQTGDLFTLNPRVKKVRISRAGKPVIDHELDVENRGLQEIALDQPGGDFEIRVLEIVPGSKPNWRETCISELEVWGTLGTLKEARVKPAVRIASLDAAPTLTREQCIKALFPTARANRIGPDKSDDLINEVAALPFREDVVICRVDHADKDGSTTVTEFAPVKRGPKPALLGQAQSQSITKRSDGEVSEGGSVSLELFQLTTTESGLLVHVSKTQDGPMIDDDATTSTLYRVTATGLVQLLEYDSSTNHGEEHHDDVCTLKPFTPTRSMPRLVVECVEESTNFHDENPRRRDRVDRKTRKLRHIWNGSTYEKK